MATIAIKDLAESVDLDRRAMTAIIGGARIGTHAGVIAQPVPAASRVVDYPPGFPAVRQPVDDGIPPQSILHR